MQVEFGSLFQFIRNGMNVKQDKSGDGLPITRIETISDATVDAGRVGYAGLSDEDCDGWLLERGDILFSHINSVEHVGKCAIYEGRPEKLVHGMNLLCLRCDQKKLLPEFAKYLIRGPAFRTRLSNFINKAVNQASVSIGNLKTIPVVVPSLPEQRRIAAILDQAEALRAKRREALVQLDELQKAIFIEMFGDPVANPKGWVVQPLFELSERVQIGPFGSQLHEEDYIDDGIPLVNPTHIKDGEIYPDWALTVPESKYQQLSQYHLSTGDLIMGRRGEMGRCAVITDTEQGWLCGTGSLFVRPKTQLLHPIYLGHVISSSSMRRYLENVAQGVTMANLNKEIVGGLLIPTPPIQLQQRYVEKLSSIAKIRNSQSHSSLELQSLFASLQHRAFQGAL